MIRLYPGEFVCAFEEKICSYIALRFLELMRSMKLIEVNQIQQDRMKVFENVCRIILFIFRI